MLYLLMICASEELEAGMSEAEMGALLGEYGAFTEELGASGALVGGERLRPIGDATTVRVRDGKTLTSDGPFAETKEQLGGYYVVDVPDLDAALAWAAKIPSAKYGSVEVRPIWEMSDEDA